MKSNRNLVTALAEDSSTLNYFIDHPSGLSLKLEDSDLTANAVLMKHLIGTLVRYVHQDQFEPYLAQTIEKQQNGRLWIFKLRSNLRCENGEPITASGFRASFLKLSKYYAQNSRIPIISDLLGWDDYLNGGDLAGLTVFSEERLQFHFSKSVNGGFLEYLCMPYFGYICASAFKEGRRIDPHFISSSGPYKLSQPADTHFARLVLREDWPLSPSGAPKYIRYHGSIEDSSWKAKNAIIQTHRSWDSDEPQNFQKVSGPPDIIRSIVLDDGPTHFFAQKSNREIFRNQIYRAKKSVPFLSKSATLAKSFYPGFECEHTAPSVSAVQPTDNLNVFIPTVETDESKFMLNIVLHALASLKWPFKLLHPGSEENLKSTDVRSRSRFDIRICNVVAGSVMEPWVVDMMFCSDLGASFPDPSGAICSFARECLDLEGCFDAKDASRQLSELVEQDAAVIPIYHGRTTWYFSRTLDFPQSRENMILPTFEDIRIRSNGDDS